jgi:hypothetical protein
LHYELLVTFETLIIKNSVGILVKSQGTDVQENMPCHMHAEDKDHKPGHRMRHKDHHAHMVKDFRKPFWVSLGVSIPVLLISPMIQNLAWATGYNAFAIPLEAGTYNILLSPATGAALM